MAEMFKLVVKAKNLSDRPQYQDVEIRIETVEPEPLITESK